MSNIIDFYKKKHESEIKEMNDKFNKEDILEVSIEHDKVTERIQIELSTQELDCLTYRLEEELELTKESLEIAESENNIDNINFYTEQEKIINKLIERLMDADDEDKEFIKVDFWELDTLLGALEQEIESFDLDSQYEGFECNEEYLLYIDILKGFYEKYKEIYFKKREEVLPMLKYLELDTKD